MKMAGDDVNDISIKLAKEDLKRVHAEHASIVVPTLGEKAPMEKRRFGGGSPNRRWKKVQTIKGAKAVNKEGIGLQRLRHWPS